MKDISLFLLKKVFKSRLNWIILALFVSGLGVPFILIVRLQTPSVWRESWKLVL